MKSIYSVFLFGCAVLFAASCSSGGGDDTPPSTGKTITLSADRSSILADGQDAAVLTLIDNVTHEDITSKASFYAGEQLLNGTSFTTEVPGTYTLKAVFGDITSNTVEIKAVSGDIDAEGITLSVSKNMVFPDGGDFAVLTLTDADGADVSDLGEFYADGKALEGRRFSTTSGSAAPITISATIGGHDVENTAEIIATSNINFTSRLLFENITMTGCQYCPFVKTIIRDVEKDDPAQVICYCIHNSVSTLYQSSQLTQTTLDYANVYCDFMLPGESDRRRAAPKSFVSRNKENHSYDSKYIQPDNLRTLARQQPKNVGIAIESAYTASEVTVHASIGTKQSFSGRAVAVLTKRMSWESDSYKYRVMLAYAPSVEGQELSFEAGKAASFNVTFDLTKLGSVNPDECEIIVFVLNAEGICQSVQYAGVGEAKSY